MSTLPEVERRRRLRVLNTALTAANTDVLVGEDELKWKTATGIHVSRLLRHHLAAALSRELGHGLARLRRRYDTAVAPPQLLPYASAAPLIQLTARRRPDAD